jgi:hypothetical protein
MIDRILINLAYATCLRSFEHTDLNRIYNIKPYLHRSDLTESNIELELMK